MIVNNNSWQLVGNGGDASLIVQNVGSSRIAYVIAVIQPEVGSLVLENGEHGILNTGSESLTVSGLDTFGKNFYVRALGAKSGALYVEAN